MESPFDNWSVPSSRGQTCYVHVKEEAVLGVWDPWGLVLMTSTVTSLLQIAKQMAGAGLVDIRNKTHTSVDKVSCTVLSVEHMSHPLPSVLWTSLLTNGFYRPICYRRCDIITHNLATSVCLEASPDPSPYSLALVLKGTQALLGTTNNEE